MGGGGAVYRARHVLLGRKVAIKVMNQELVGEQQLISRFFHEARIVNAIHHPNIIDIVDFLDLHQPRRVAYVMELLRGRPLSKVTAAGPISVKQCANAGLQIASVLKAVHEMRVVHRDLKPDNVFVLASMEDDWSAVPSIKVLDFGVAKLAPDEVSHRTESGVAVGTPIYMAPEQIVAAPVSAATDVYALGEIIYEMLAGKRLFQGSHTEILSQKISANPKGSFDFPQMSDSRAIESLVRACIALNAEDRPPLATIVESLTLMARGETAPINVPVPVPMSVPIAAIAPVRAPGLRPPPSQPRTFAHEPSLSDPVMTPPPTRARTLFVGGAAAVLAGIAFVVWTTLHPPETTSQPTPVASATATPVATPITAPVATTPPADAIVRLTSVPPGATITDETTRADLGKTPARIPLPAGVARAIRVSMPGYQGRAMQLDSKHLDLQVVLNRGEDDVRRPKATVSPKISAAPESASALPDASPTPTPPAVVKPLRKDETTTW